MKASGVRSSAWRLSIAYMALLVVSLGVFAAVGYALVDRMLEEQLRNQLRTDLDQLLIDYWEDGIEELKHDIQERVDAATPHRPWYFLVDPDGVIHFDGIESLPNESGWFPSALPDGTPVLLRVRTLPDDWVVAVGGSLEPLRHLQAVSLRATLLALFFALFLGLLGSLLLSRHITGRLEAFRVAAQQVGRGNLSQRLDLSGTGDDLDQIAGIVNRMLDRIESLVGNVRRVSTSIAHDLRTPLGRIRQELETLAVAPDRPPEAIEALVTQLDGVLDTFTALLRIAELDSGARRSAFRELDLRDVVTQVEDAFAAPAEAVGVLLRCELPAAPVPVRGDAQLLVQALVNLVENALHHAGGRELHLSLEPLGEVSGDAASGSGGCIALEDQGPGIDEALLARVTEPFFRADPSRRGTGAGLGLSLADAIVKLHYGTLELRNTEQGLRAEIRLPAADQRPDG